MIFKLLQPLQRSPIMVVGRKRLQREKKVRSPPHEVAYELSAGHRKYAFESSRG